MPHPRPPGLRFESRQDEFGREQDRDFDESRSEDVPLVDGIKFGDLLPVIQIHVKQDYKLKCKDKDSWRNLPELPSSAEIMPADETAELQELPQNNITKSWDTKENYISTHYKLLRADGLTPLKEAVRTYKSFPDMMDDRNVCVYTQVHIVGYTWATSGAAPRIEFSYERSGKRIRWHQTKRLQQGTIVALSPVKDNFKSICKVASVAARPLGGVEQNPPQIDLYWGNPKDAEFDPSEEFVMIEARSGYFEASRHMLVAMQKLMTEEFPMTAPLIDSTIPIGTPQFLIKQPLMNLNGLVPPNIDVDGSARPLPRLDLNNVNILGPWPAIETAGLDTSQFEALESILTKKLAIVQGPPGTGKTFVSICALKIMLDNWSTGDPPIIIAAQTNHALDQLLLLLAEKEPYFLRLGGRTAKDNEVILSRTLFHVRKHAPPGAEAPRYNYKNSKKVLDDQAGWLAEDITKALAQDSGEAQRLLSFNFITQEQFDSLEDDEWEDDSSAVAGYNPICSWLGQDQMARSEGCPAMNLGFLEEEPIFDFEELDEREAEEKRANDDEDIDVLRGGYFNCKEDFIGKSTSAYSDTLAVAYLRKHADMYEIPAGARGLVYRYLRTRLKREMRGTFLTHLEDYGRAAQGLKIAKWLAEGYLIKRLGIKLIGCTTTGLSKYRGLLASLQPRTLLIEEAAETTEGTVLAAMYESIEQLILVGDHQQLQATCNMEYLAVKPYDLAVSMFERMVNNSVSFTMLNTQRRMIPELRQLLSSFYPALRDHPDVEDRVVNRRPVPGMGGRNSWFFHHTWPESRDESASRSNKWEAEFIHHFYAYLVLNGLKAAQITVLTFYNGQRKVLLSLLRKHPHLRTIDPSQLKVFTVDSYQGEENDVILLSLVRNNEESNIGFLENRNRAVVSLSRARRGFYLFGNAINLLQSSHQSYDVWGSVTDALRKQGRPDSLTEQIGLPLICEKHDRQTVAMYPDDFESLHGGCENMCGGELNCGHSCPYKCHPFDHAEVICTESCPRSVSGCGHRCSTRCGDACICNACRNKVMGQARYVSTIQNGGHLDMPPNLEAELKVAYPRSRIASSVRASPDTSYPITATPSKIEGLNLFSDWATWDAQAADRDIAVKRLQEAETRRVETPINGGGGPVFREIHRQTALDENGERKTLYSVRQLRENDNKKSYGGIEESAALATNTSSPSRHYHSVRVSNDSDGPQTRRNAPASSAVSAASMQNVGVPPAKRPDIRTDERHMPGRCGTHSNDLYHGLLSSRPVANAPVFTQAIRVPTGTFNPPLNFGSLSSLKGYATLNDLAAHLKIDESSTEDQLSEVVAPDVPPIATATSNPAEDLISFD